MRSVYTPHPPAVRNSEGHIEFSDSKPKLLAEYLSTKVWHDTPDTNTIPSPSIQIFPDLSPFSYIELTLVLSKLRSNRSPGSDEIRAEVIKWSSYDFHLSLLSLLNKCFLAQEVPKDWQHSLVVMLPKPNTQDPLSPSSYRPISLTQSMYKVYATLLRTRLKKALDPHLRPSQFGFRPSKSAHQPIFVLRRTLELFERSSSSLHCIFLDWTKAFDSITHKSILHALVFYGVPEPLTNAILSLYSQSTFQVKTNQGTSSTFFGKEELDRDAPSPLTCLSLFSPISCN